ncbi:PIN domain-containing protein [Kerstersia gyiorum]|uniref:PIN domain-containing protein n=1 Tax=Kerstersia gyiorum TaxID=206506 RepID=UPI002097D42C|nr:PIN domain-containing protein [Kerstersia gyiorum]MCO7636655.1 PIN domain-containing protein [Pseudomonas sp. S 311-6]MCP1633214.1 putative nucleic acid-binding protein [Kerstersia gyiorum]MCP1636084.1 putative nucleic acid-binding protein [Kerstersia gyiorum]MCP1672224.1 putative nucleic acid-binding protein [Kerstersia gyiorum]MCP1680287.1 putative nucleic acid-binding protein [Kerstersia gyiorum]
MKIVIDTNILISLLNKNDCSHNDVAILMEHIKNNSCEILSPSLFLWEFYAYNQHPEKIKNHNQDPEVQLKITYIDVTMELFSQTFVECSVNISGADRVFISVAKAHEAPLITNDKRILDNAKKLGVRAVSPIDFIRSYGTDR